jgi:uncharacterized membrane protein
MKATEFIKKELIIWLIVLAPFVYALVYWNQLPERMPVHWSMDGKPNGYSSKGFGILEIPLLSLGLYFLLLLIPKIDPKKANFAQFEGTYRTIRLLLHTVLTIAFVMGLLYAMNSGINSAYFSVILISGLFMVLGNFMGKIRPNYFVGIRTPWTLANEDVWVKTHRVTGRLWVAASFIYLIINLFMQMPHWFHYIYLTLITVFPFIYSYVKYREIDRAV